MSKDPSIPVNKTFVVVSLVLAAALIVGVLAGAKVYFNRVALQPVSMPELPSPAAGSPECTSLIDALPDEILGHRRARLAEPAPAGAAAWQSSSHERITLRCGVDMPLQYNEYTPTFEAGGAQWMRIDDPVTGSDLSTWYTTDRSPVLAVTADRQAVGGDPVAQLNAGALPRSEHDPAPAPLSQLAAGPAADGTYCGDLQEALPDSIAEGYNRVSSEEGAIVWQAEGKEPIVVRCNVAHPENYQPGLQLYQINGVTWFEDTQLSPSPGASTWFALGRDAVVAAHLPQGEGNAAVTALSEAIEASLPARQAQSE
ncbi:DUF3515 domain-containing protein [Corynebacterium qintianiae]|uniref:DUF3515 domain-containing protein n=1 Tax=Corynebacterium qintianiae TaxID=2709392 RepID=A0A7T0KPQ0_9CORY|nr:DUF3515 domain-containing protein [Corynebacterium qintianiae]QPK84100.1 DUF3515 domain-containing protein [Corynebacterium qintianiae]